MKGSLLFLSGLLSLLSMNVGANLPPLDVPEQAAPVPAWTTEAEVVSVHDGDTFTVDIKRRFEVRVIDCWAPEVHKDAEREAGLKSRDHLIKLLEQGGKKVIVSVPGVMRKRDGYYDPGDSTSISRILAHVWIDGDDWPLNERMIAAGHAKRESPSKKSE